MDAILLVVSVVELPTDPVFLWLVRGTAAIAIVLLAWALADFIIEHW